MKNFLLLSTIVILGLITVSITNAQNTYPDYQNEVVVEFGNATLTRGELAEYAIYQAGTLIFDNGDLLTQLIIKNAADQKGIIATDEEVEKAYKEASFFAESQLSKTRFESVPKQIMMPRMERLVLLEKLLNISVTEAEAKAFYNRPSSFISPDMAHVIRITTDTRTKANNAKNMLKDGSDPRSVFDKWSSEKHIELLKATHGDIGWGDRNSFHPTIAQTIFDSNNGKGMTKGSYTDIIPINTMVMDEKTKDVKEITEYRIYYIVDIDRAHKFPYDTVKDAALYQARMDKIASATPNFILDELNKYKCKIKENLFDPNSPLVEKNINKQFSN